MWLGDRGYTYPRGSDARLVLEFYVDDSWIFSFMVYGQVSQLVDDDIVFSWNLLDAEFIKLLNHILNLIEV